MDSATLDAIVNDERLLPYRGWHDDQIPGEDYLPAMQQVREEFVAFADLLAEKGINGKCLQIGLGMAGAAHLAFEAMFREAWTVERDASFINRLMLKIPGEHNIVFGDARQDETRGMVQRHAPFDMLFIDGDHGYREVCSDYLRYKPFVRAGGLVAFHDAAATEYQVLAFLNDLRTSGVEVGVIGTALGIAWTTE